MKKLRGALLAGLALAALTATGASAASVYFGVGSGPYYGSYYDDDSYYRYHHPYWGARYDNDDGYYRHHYWRSHYYRDYDNDGYWHYHGNNTWHYHGDDDD
jgi:hypothetical protein